MKFHKDSEVKARYALAVLRVAQSANREVAARLVQGLAKDLPHPEEQHEVAALHFEAIEAFENLAESLRVSEAVSPFWQTATALASRWLRAVEYK